MSLLKLFYTLLCTTTVVIIILIIVTMLYSSRASAWETDQYTLPPTPLAETGEEVSRYVYEKLKTSLNLVAHYKAAYPDKIKKIESDLSEKEANINNIKYSFSGQDKRNNLSRLRQKTRSLQQDLQDAEQLLSLSESQLGFMTIVNQTIGEVIAEQEKRDAIWGGASNIIPYPSGMKQNSAVAFCPDRFDSIYAYAGFHRVLHPSHFVFSSTVQLYGIDIGMDKLGHIFNEGFQYYLLYHEAKKQGQTHQEALTTSVTWGIETENSYYGRWVSGIYSNADLASNYAGLHFYLNLFDSLAIDTITYPPILVKNKNGEYQINDVSSNHPTKLLARFISPHMNEALNPSSLEYMQYIVVKEAVKNRCLAWKEKYSEAMLLNFKALDLTLWNEQNYGFVKHNTVSVLDYCF